MRHASVFQRCTASALTSALLATSWPAPTFSQDNPKRLEEALRGSEAYKRLQELAEGGTQQTAMDSAASADRKHAGGERAGACAAPPPPIAAATEVLDPEFRRAMEAALSAERLQEYVARVADPYYEGRGAGTKKSAEFIEYLLKHLDKAGVPAKTQPFTVLPFTDFPFGGRRLESMVRPAHSKNVIARIEGSDPELSKDVIVICAHFDHLVPTRDLFRWLGVPIFLAMTTGIDLVSPLLKPLGHIGVGGLLSLNVVVLQLLFRDFGIDIMTGRWLPLPGPKKIFPGADDNGSGTAALMALADAFGELSRKGVRPKRSIVLAFFDAEEVGLVGSKQFVKRLSAEERNRIVQVINLDMIGWSKPDRPDALKVILPPTVPLLLQVFVGPALPVLRGEELIRRKNPILKQKLESVNARLGLGFKFEYTNYEFNGSDQYSFFMKRRPDGGRTSVVFFFDGGPGPYHREQDESPTIDGTYASRVARLAAGLAWEIANTDTTPRYQE